MIDVSEDFAVSSGADSSELDEFRANVLPVLLYLQDACQVRVVSWCIATFTSSLRPISDVCISWNVFKNLK